MYSLLALQIKMLGKCLPGQRTQGKMTVKMAVGRGVTIFVVIEMSNCIILQSGHDKLSTQMGKRRTEDKTS